MRTLILPLKRNRQSTKQLCRAYPNTEAKKMNYITRKVAKLRAIYQLRRIAQAFHRQNHTSTDRFGLKINIPLQFGMLCDVIGQTSARTGIAAFVCCHFALNFPCHQRDEATMHLKIIVIIRYRKKLKFSTDKQTLLIRKARQHLP